MSWWDTRHLTSFATQALKTAQKKIDSVLDIKEDIADESLIEKEEESLFNKWLPTEKLMPSSTLVIESLSYSPKENILTDHKVDEIKLKTKNDFEENTSCSIKSDFDLFDCGDLTFLEKKLISVQNKQNKSTIGSSKSAFKKFRDFKEHLTEEDTIPVADSFYDLNNKTIDKEKSLFLSGSVQYNKESDVKDVSLSNNIDTYEVTCGASESKINSPEGELAKPVLIKLSKNEPEFVKAIHFITECDATFGLDNTDSSKCWSDASLNQMLDSLKRDQDMKCNEVNSSEPVKLIRTSSEATLIDDYNKDLVSVNPQQETVAIEDITDEMKSDKLHKKKVLSSSSPCVAKFMLGTTVVTESSLENSTSDDMSESNKTLTGDEGLNLVSSLANFCDLQFDETPTSASSASLTFTDNMDVAKVNENEDKIVFFPAKCRTPEVVQEMIEEAMNEGIKESIELGKSPNDSCSPKDAHGNEKAHPEVPLPAESGQTSGHTSADEIDTTTSSDIEIISHMSTPSFLGSSWRQPTGDKHPAMTSFGAPLYGDLSPSSKRTANQSGSPSGAVGHRRSDSGSSGQSSQSRNGEDFVSIDFVTIKSGFVDVRHRKSMPSGINQQHLSSDENELLTKKLLELEEILEVREKKVLELSQVNIDLQETNFILRNQLAQAETTNEVEREDLQSLTDEFAKRIAESEKKLQAAVKEKDALRRAMLNAEAEIKSNNTANDRLIRGKDQTIAELMAEGEKLSKQYLQINTAVKKLRAKDKENEEKITFLKGKNEDQKGEIERLEGILESKLDAEKKYADTITQSNIILKSNEEEMNRLKNDLEDAVEKSKSFKVALDNSYKEMSELHRARMTDVTEAHKAATMVELSARGELMKVLDEQKSSAKKIESQLILQIEDLQLSMSILEKDYGRRDDSMMQEISDLQQRLQEAEERNQELTRSISTVTRPLLRQIENIQSTFLIQSNNFERIERSLSDRLGEAQNQLMSSVEKEQIASERLSELSSHMASLDIQTSSLRQDKARLHAELEMERSKLTALEDTKHIIITQKDALIRKLEEEIKDSKKDKLLLESQLEMERAKVDTEKKKYCLISDQLKEKEMQLQTWSLKSTPTPQPSEDILKHSTLSTPINDESQDKGYNWSRNFYLEGNGKQSVYDSIKGASASTIIENLQSQLKLREGEITHLLSNISELERTRESLAQELVNVSTLNEDLQSKLESLSEMEVEYNEASQRHNALLQMYGEKVEEADELRMDLQDIKEIYKCQMDDLLKLKSRNIPG